MARVFIIILINNGNYVGREARYNSILLFLVYFKNKPVVLFISV